MLSKGKHEVVAKIKTDSVTEAQPTNPKSQAV